MHLVQEMFPVLRSGQEQAVSVPVLLIDPGSADVAMPTQSLHSAKAGSAPRLLLP